MDLTRLSQNELMARCGWCHRKLGDDEECFGAGARVSPLGQAFITENEGKLVRLPLSTGHEIIAIVTTAESEARAAGHDIYLQACSEACCAAATAALRAELPGKN